MNQAVMMNATQRLMSTLNRVLLIRVRELGEFISIHCSCTDEYCTGMHTSNVGTELQKKKKAKKDSAVGKFAQFLNFQTVTFYFEHKDGSSRGPSGIVLFLRFCYLLTELGNG